MEDCSYWGVPIWPTGGFKAAQWPKTEHQQSLVWFKCIIGRLKDLRFHGTPKDSEVHKAPPPFKYYSNKINKQNGILINQTQKQIVWDSHK